MGGFQQAGGSKGPAFVFDASGSGQSIQKRKGLVAAAAAASPSQTYQQQQLLLLLLVVRLGLLQQHQNY